MNKSLRVTKSADARADIKAAARYIARDNLNAALKWLSDLDDFFLMIGRIPGVGTSLDNIEAGLRSVAFGNYLVFYSRHPRKVQIARVIQGNRDWESELRKSL